MHRRVAGRKARTMSRDPLRKARTPPTSDHRWLRPAGPLWQPKPVRPETSASGNGVRGHRTDCPSVSDKMITLRYGVLNSRK